MKNAGQGVKYLEICTIHVKKCVLKKLNAYIIKLRRMKLINYAVLLDSLNSPGLSA